MALHEKAAFAIDTEIVENKMILPDVYGITVKAADISKNARAGQFIHVRIDAGMIFLRRPLGVADVDEKQGTLTMFYRLIGNGTHALSKLKAGDNVNCLGPLGNGFSLAKKKTLIIGGGMGLAPLILLSRRLPMKADLLIGGRNEDEVFWEKYFSPYVDNIFVTTDDGSKGRKGFTTDYLPEILDKNHYGTIYVCGPDIMMRKIYEIAKRKEIPCQVSLERRMACGMGACLSCAIDTNDGKRKKVCVDGPVFEAQEVL